MTLGKAILAFALAILMAPVEVAAKPAVTNYAQQKKDMEENAYVLYRLLERIMQANAIAEPISIASRSLCSDATRECEIISNLPRIEKSDNFMMWALQLIYGTHQQPNADANSQINLIRVGRSLQNSLSTNPGALACVVAHEAAHITQNHTKSRLRYLSELDKSAAVKISSAIGNAHAAKKSNEFWTAFAMGMNAFSSGYNSSSGNLAAANQANLNNMLLLDSYNRDMGTGAQIAPVYKQLIQQNMSQLRLWAPETMNSLDGLNGLPASLVKRTMKDINEYLGEFAQKYKEFSRENETEADLIAMEYTASAGIDPKGCIQSVELLHRTTDDPSTQPLDTHPGETERIRALEAKYTNLPTRLKHKYKNKQLPYKPLPYLYDKETQIVTVTPPGGKYVKAGKNSKAQMIDAMLGK